MKTTDFLKMFMGGKPTSEKIVAIDTNIIEGYGSPWISVRLATEGFLFNAPSSGASARVSAGTYSILRTFALFDFSNLKQTVTSARLFFNSHNIYGLTKMAQNCPNTGTLSEADYDNFNSYFGTSGGYILDELARSVYFIDLNADAINEINSRGLTRFALRDDRDYDNVMPTVDQTGSYLEGVNAYIVLNY